jgi:hypothetical protein
MLTPRRSSLQLAGIEVPSEYDGRSLVPLLTGPDTPSARAQWRTRTVISFAEGYFQYWGKVGISPANPAEPSATINPPDTSASGVTYTFDNPDNQWRMLRVANATHNVSFVEWDPDFYFKAVAFSALFDLAADPYQSTNLWPNTSAASRAAWHAELEKEFTCHGHYGAESDCS